MDKLDFGDPQKVAEYMAGFIDKDILDKTGDKIGVMTVINNLNIVVSNPEFKYEDALVCLNYLIMSGDTNIRIAGLKALFVSIFFFNTTFTLDQIAILFGLIDDLGKRTINHQLSIIIPPGVDASTYRDKINICINLGIQIFTVK